MKKALIQITFFALASLCAVVPVQAGWLSPATTGEGKIFVTELSAPAAVSGTAVTGAAAFHGIIVKTDGVNNVTLNVSDGASALIPTDTLIPGSDRIWAISYNPPIKCTTGIAVTISVAGGGSAVYQVQYDQ